MAAPKTELKTKILIVEDEVAIVTLLRYNLEKEGFQVIATGDGEEAVTLVKERRPDIIVLVLNMPRITGFEVLKELGLIFLLPLIGAQMGMDLNILSWILGPASDYLLHLVATLTGLKG